MLDQRRNEIPEDIGDYLALSDKAMSGLVWKKVLGPKTKIGKQAGSWAKNGYYQLQFKGGRYYAHRIIAALKDRAIGSPSASR